jgi:hypothetical protein
VDITHWDLSCALSTNWSHGLEVFGSIIAVGGRRQELNAIVAARAFKKYPETETVMEENDKSM